MSCSSDSEEFFDAEDKSFEPISSSKVDKDVEVYLEPRKLVDDPKTSSDLLSLSEKLKREQLEIERRRREEDEALQKKFAALQELAEQEKRKLEEQEELKRKVQENELKRLKLERMRESMHSESTPHRTSPPLPTQLTPGIEATRQFHSDLAGQGQGDVGSRIRGQGQLDTDDLAGQGASRTETEENRLNDKIERNHMLKRYMNDLEKSFDSSDGNIDMTMPLEASFRTMDLNDPNDEHMEPGDSKSDAKAADDHTKTANSQNEQYSTTNTQSSVIKMPDAEPDLIQSVKRSSLDKQQMNELEFPTKSTAIKNECPSKTATADSFANLSKLAPTSGMPRRPSTSSILSTSSNRLSRPTSAPPPPPSQKTNQPQAEVIKPDMPPPANVPPMRKKNQPEITEEKDFKSITKDILRPKTLGSSQGLGLSSDTNSKCLMSAPSPLVARKNLDLSCLESGDKMVTAAEEECTRAVNDLHSEEIGQGDADLVLSAGKDDVTPTTEIDDEKATEEYLNFRENFKSHSFPRSTSLIQPTPEGREKDLLQMSSVLNLDTGQRITMNEAEQKIPQGINPLSLHIMRRTKEYVSDQNLHQDEKDGDNKDKNATAQTITTVKPVGKRKKRLKKFFGKAKQKIKTVKDEVMHKAESSPSSSDDESDEARRMIKIKAAHSHKGPYDFDLLVPVQDIPNAHNGAVWTMKWSHCGRLLATGGQDNLLRVWVLKDAFAYFDDMRQKYNEERKRRMSPSRSDNSVESDSTSEAASEMSSSSQSSTEDWFAPFNRKPFCTYKGHSADILDLSWSKNYFLLTSSMDKTVRLWHVSRKECLCCFQHIDFVTAIAFHPKDDRYFLSGSLDGKLRLWNIPEKKVAVWNEVNGSTKLITAANFCMNGKFAVVGTYDGRCVFYSTEQLKYYTQIHVRSTRGKNSKGRKVTGVEPLPGEDKILVSSNDSRIRLYDLRDLTLTCKYRGCMNNSSQIKASFSHDGRFLVSGSEDHYVYIWRVQHEFHTFSSARRDRNDYWESIKAHNASVTVAMFSPKPNLVIKPQFEYLDSDDKQSTPEVRGEVLISADYNGTMKVFINKFKPGSG